MNGTGGSKKQGSIPIPWRSARHVIREALREDIGKGDFTTTWLFGPEEKGEAVLTFKEGAIVAGLDIASHVWGSLDAGAVVRKWVSDGDQVEEGTTVARVSGKLRAILAGERTALNLLQRLSGIATLTRKFVTQVSGTGVKILDTRKTTPGLRPLEKYAVSVAGGVNHRSGLYDMVLIKENHAGRSGGLTEAFERIRQKNRVGLPVEMEVKNLEELEEVLELPVSRIMLDNMSLEEMKRAARMTREARGKGMKPLLEASGNITLENVREVALTGIDLISVGLLTHSAPAVDISCLVE